MPKEHDCNRSDRLLRTMHPVLSHDLPNQLVALQSLLQMLELDEAPSLGAPGQETVHRLQRVARKTSELVRFLKELERLGSYQCRLEEILLASLIREVKVELKQQCPALALECTLAGDVSTVVADPRLLKQAVVELLRCLLDSRIGGIVALQLAAQKVGNDTELRGMLKWSALPAQATQQSFPAGRIVLNKRLEIVLAQELLAVGGGRLTEVSESVDCSPFTLLLPQRSAHV